MDRLPNNVPVFIKNLEHYEDGDKTYTKAQLKVFYIGETADHRLFTKDFSNKIVKTLPLTPVVGFYSEEDEDFRGHNKIQYVYGVVPDTATMAYETDEKSGNTFLITDVILFTERQDNIGEVAKKIIGKQHSLELDPKSLKYKINRDSQGRFLNIEFIDGKFVGLSVLGDEEKPAFTGSSFFTTNENFEQIASNYKEKIDEFIDFLNNNGGSIEVFNSENFFNKLKENFAKISMQEFQEKIYRALNAMDKCGWLVENTDEYAIVSMWLEEEERPAYIKYSIAINGDELALENPVEVKVKYLTEEELTALEPSVASETDFTAKEDDEDKDKDGNCETDQEEEDTQVEPTEETEPVEESAEEPTQEEEEEEESKKDDEDDFSAQPNTEGELTNASQSIVQSEEEDEQMGTPAASASATTLSDSEKQELENYRREEKQRLINEYKGDIDDADVENYIANIDSYSKEELENKLNASYRKFKKTQSEKDETNKTITAFSIISTANEDNYNENNPADVINKYAKRK